MAIWQRQNEQELVAEFLAAPDHERRRLGDRLFAKLRPRIPDRLTKSAVG